MQYGGVCVFTVSIFVRLSDRLPTRLLQSANHTIAKLLINHRPFVSSRDVRFDRGSYSLVEPLIVFPW